LPAQIFPCNAKIDTRQCGSLTSKAIVLSLSSQPQYQKRRLFFLFPQNPIRLRLIYMIELPNLFPLAPDQADGYFYFPFLATRIGQIIQHFDNLHDALNVMHMFPDFGFIQRSNFAINGVFKMKAIFAFAHEWCLFFFQFALLQGAPCECTVVSGQRGSIVVIKSKNTLILLLLFLFQLSQ
jgi:hypothetical protein